MRRFSTGAVLVILLMVPLSAVVPRGAAPRAGSGATELGSYDLPTALAELPSLTVHYFRSHGELSEARFAVDFSSRPASGMRRIVARIRSLDSNGPSRDGNEDVIDDWRWTSSRVAPRLYRSRALLLPGRYGLELAIEHTARSATIDRILDVPAFPRDELTVSSIIAVSETVPSEMVRRVDRGRALSLYAEAYPPACSEGRTSVSMQLRLHRAGKIVREQRYEIPCSGGRALLVERLETDSLDPGPYVLRARASLPSFVKGEVAVSPGLELTIEDPSDGRPR